jgi:polyferredoxin
MSFDLTRLPGLRRAVKSPLFPGVIQAVALVVFGALIVLGWNFHGIRGVPLPDPLAYTNLTTLFFWVIWLMGLIILIPFIGRLWCTICPLGLINDLLARFGLRRRYPRVLRNFLLAAALLLFYNGYVAVRNVSHYPDLSSRLLLAVVAMLVLAGLLFRGRIFCGYLCPIGAMIGVYSRISPWRLEVRDRDRCRTCETKACYTGDVRWFRLGTPFGAITFPYRRPGCQVDLFPPELVEDPHCVMCTQCIKNCPYDNITWGTRPFLRGITGGMVPSRSETIFMMVLMGATFGIFTRVWPGLSKVVNAPGEWVVGLVGATGSWAAALQIAWAFALLPVLAVHALAAVAWLFSRSEVTPVETPPESERRVRFDFGLAERQKAGEDEQAGWRGERLSIVGLTRAFTVSFMPLILASHAAFALVKLNEKIAYLPGALRDPTGVKFYLAIHRLGMLAAPRELVPLAFLRWVAMAAVLAGTVASVVSAWKLAGSVYADRASWHRRAGGVFVLANVLLGSLLATLVVKWLF